MKLENLIVAVATFSLALLVVLATSYPHTNQIDLDFSELMPASNAHQVTLKGVIFSSDFGWRPFKRETRIIFHRPLPETFEMEAEAEVEGKASKLSIELGGARGTMSFGTGIGPAIVEMSNPDGLRELRLSHERVGAPTLTRMTIRPVGVQE